MSVKETVDTFRHRRRGTGIRGEEEKGGGRPSFLYWYQVEREKGWLDTESLAVQKRRERQGKKRLINVVEILWDARPDHLISIWYGVFGLSD